MSSPEAVETTEPPGPTGLADSARELAEGRTTSVEQVSAALRRIEASQGTLNAFRHLRAEAALAEAVEADRRLAAGSGCPCSACRSPSRTIRTSPGCRPTSAATAICPPRPRTASPYGG